MFGRLILARLKVAVRSKRYMFWTLFFPLGLTTLFYFAFSSIYDSIKSEPIPVVVEVNDSAINEYKTLQAFSMLDREKLESDLEQYYIDKSTAEAMGNEFDEEPPISEDDLDILNSLETFDDITSVPISIFNDEYTTGDYKLINENDMPLVKVLKELEYENGVKMVELVECNTHEEAEQLLKDGDISGIITIDGLKDVELLINGDGVNHSILSSIISEYLLQVDLTIDKINDNPDEQTDMDTAIDTSTFNLNYVDEKNTDGENKDPFIPYFYNLLAMVCLMGATASLNSVVNTQANQTMTGIRIDSSPVNKVVLELADLVAIGIIQIGIIIITLTYMLYILGLKFGGNTALIFLTALFASTAGTTLGYFIGHIGSLKQEAKESIAMVIFLGGGFMSGLMYGDMKAIIEEKCPLFNRINPSAVVTDAFVALNLYGVGDIYYRSIIYLIVFDLIMLVLGILLSRRKSYKSL